MTSDLHIWDLAGELAEEITPLYPADGLHGLMHPLRLMGMVPDFCQTYRLPAEDFLLSVDDYAHLLHLGRAPTSVEVLPLRGYWGFYSSSRYLLGRILQIPVRWYFNEFMSWQWTKPLRATALNPWLILYFRKQG